MISRAIPAVLLVGAGLMVGGPIEAAAQSAPRMMSGCFVLERMDGQSLPLPNPFEILLLPQSGMPDAKPEATTAFPGVAQPVSPSQMRGTWMGRSGTQSAFFEFSVYADRLRGTIWLTEGDDEARGYQVYAIPTACPTPQPPV